MTWTIHVHNPHRLYLFGDFEECEAALAQWLMTLDGGTRQSFTGHIFQDQSLRYSFHLETAGLEIWEYETGQPA